MSAIPAFGAHQPPHDPAALARDILTQPRFRVQAPAARTWWDVLRHWLGERWNQLVDAFSQHVHIGARTSVAFGDVLIAVIVALIVAVAARMLIGIAREGTAAARGAAAPLDAALDPAALHDAALRAAARGAYAAAIAHEFRAALATLDARGVLRDDPARTVNECRRDVRARAPRIAGAFESMARAFTAAVYAEDRIDAGVWSEVERAYAAFTAPQTDAA